MSCFKRLFGPKEPIDWDKCRFEVIKDPSPPSIGKWGSRFVSLLFSIPMRIYNTCLLLKNGELRGLAFKSMDPSRPVCPLKTLFFSFNSTAIPKFMQTILRSVRKDPENGLFDDQDNKLVFLLLVKELFPEEHIEENDSLLTCTKDHVSFHRQPLLQFLGRSNIEKNGVELVKVANEVVDLYKDGKEINATEMAFTFTTTVISRLLLGHPGPMDKYREISLALDTMNRIAIKKAFHQTLSAQEEREYANSQKVMRQAIETALNSKDKTPLGSLVEALKDKMTQKQIKVALFNVFFAGSETAAALLAYLFWQLGQHPEYQETIYSEIKQDGDLFKLAAESPTLNQFFAESIRLFTPGYIISRRAATDLICRATNQEGRVVFKQRILKGESIVSIPTYAARHPLRFKDPDTFIPGRFSEVPRSLEWRPFGDGAHSCPGQQLATLEVLTLAAAVIRQFTFTSSPQKEIGQKGLLTLKPAETVKLTVTPRVRV